MYDPAYSNVNSHRAGRTRTYLINVLGVQKVGFWADMPNRFIPPSASRSTPQWEDHAIKFRPKVADYVSQDIKLNPSKSPTPGKVAPTNFAGQDTTPQQSQNTINYEAIRKGFDFMSGADQGAGYIEAHGIDSKTMTTGFITQEEMTKGDVLSAKPKVKKAKPMVKKGVTMKAAPVTSNSMNYYKPAPYQSTVKPVRLGNSY